MAKIKKVQKISIKKISVAVLLVIAMIVQISFLSYLFKAIAPNSNKNDQDVLMSYTSNGKLDYKVYLKENNFIEKEYIDQGEAYVLDLIDHISITTLYNYKSSSKSNVTGTNKVVARLKAYYKESSDKNNNPEIMNKEKVLDEKIINFNDDKYSTINSFNINLDEYVKQINEFQSEVKISLDGYLEISQINDFNGKVGGVTYNDKYTNSLKIPLSDSVIKIENEKVPEKENKVYKSDLVKTNKVVMGYIVAANIITFIIICLLLKKLFMFTNKTEYERTLNKILKNYDDIIVNTTTMVDYKNYKLIKIEEFKEMLNLSRELLLPIMNYEVEKGKYTCFYIVKDNLLYAYTIKDKNNNVKKEC